MTDTPSVSERGSATRALLLDVAEELIGARGMDVSLREIAAAAGQRNNSAVRYHFGDKDGLIDALMYDRIGKAEARRQVLVDRAGDLSSCSAAELLEMLWQPLLDLDNGQGSYCFIRFLLGYQVMTGGHTHPIGADPERHPAFYAIISALNARFSHLSFEQFGYRLGLMAMMFWSAVAMHYHAAVKANLVWSAKFSLAESIKLTIGALSVPA
jgi:AcrR family transcriptional regulator